MREYQLKAWAVIASFVMAFFIEYYLIVVEQFENFQSAFGNWGGFFIYAIVTILSLLFLRIAFRRIKAGRFASTFGLALIFVFAIGLFWSYYQGYVNEQLFDPYWMLTHDFVYTCLVSQFVVFAVLLLGTKEVGDEEVEEEADYEEEYI